MRAVLDHIVLTILAAAIVPGVAYTAIQYLRSEIGLDSVLVAGGAGLIAAVILLSLKIREQNQQIQQTRRSAIPASNSPVPLSDSHATTGVQDPSIEDNPAQTDLNQPDPAIEGSYVQSPYHLDAESIWAPYTTRELVAKVRGLTDVERDAVVRNYLGRSMRVIGTARNVSRFALDDNDEIYATVNLPNGITVSLETTLEPWKEMLASIRVGEEVEAIGRIVRVSQHGTITLAVRQLLPPQIMN